MAGIGDVPARHYESGNLQELELRHRVERRRSRYFAKGPGHGFGMTVRLHALSGDAYHGLTPIRVEIVVDRGDEPVDPPLLEPLGEAIPVGDGPSVEDARVHGADQDE